jgi:metal-responsive CopG/Arc/MetJ family transcriptional regulator
MKTAISIPDKTFSSADRLAKKMKMSRSELYARAVQEFVTEHAGLNVREKLDQVYAAKSSAMDPSLAHAQATAIAHEDW